MNAAALFVAPVAPANAGAADRASDSAAADLFGAMMQAAVGEGTTQAPAKLTGGAKAAKAADVTGPDAEQDAASAEAGVDGVLVALLAQAAPAQPTPDTPTGPAAALTATADPATAPAVAVVEDDLTSEDQAPATDAAPADAKGVSLAAVSDLIEATPAQSAGMTAADQPQAKAGASDVAADLASKLKPATSKVQPSVPQAPTAQVQAQAPAPSPQAAVADLATPTAAAPPVPSQPAPSATPPLVAELAALLKTARAERVQAKAAASPTEATPETADPETADAAAMTDGEASLLDAFASDLSSTPFKATTERPTDPAQSRAPGDRLAGEKLTAVAPPPEAVSADVVTSPKPTPAAATLATAEASAPQVADAAASAPLPADAAPVADVAVDPLPQAAAAPAEAKSAPPSIQPVNPPALSRASIETTIQLSAKIQRMLEGRSSRFDMVLTPDELGRVDVSVEIDDDGQLTARLAFDNPAAAADLRARADELRGQLRDAGFRLEDGALDFSHRDPNASGDQGRTPLHQKLGRLFPRLESAEPVLPPSTWTRLNQTPDRVDVRV